MSGVVCWVAAVGSQRPTIAKASTKQRPYDAPCVLSNSHARMISCFGNTNTDYSVARARGASLFPGRA